jgi:phage terminase large subunit
MSLERPLRILCAREVQKSIADSVKRLLDDDIARMGADGFFDSTLTEIRTAIGGLFIFAGLRSNIETVKSTEGVDIAWVEEANAVSQSSMDILIPTIRKEGSEIWLSWNPKDKKDPVDKMFRGGTPPPDSIIRKVTWEDNPWFPDVLRKEMEWDRQRDPDKYAHVWLGEYLKNSEARVFRNWRIDTFEVPRGARPYFGGDWGFAIDPNVLIKAWIVGRTLYIEEEAYAVGCPIDKTPFLFGGADDAYLIEKNTQAWKALTKAEREGWKGIPGARKWPITADSARPETIDYMRRHGFPHIQAARKGPGSVEDGIEFLKSFDIIVNPACVHTIDELTLYSYKVDKLTGEVLPVLEDKKNNVIDSLRYAAEGVRVMDGGMVYATPETDIIIPSIRLPSHWAKAYALDIDGANTSCLWGAHDKESDTLYIYAEYTAGRSELALVADAVRNRGSWIPGLFDHLSRKRSKPEGQRITEALLDLKLDIFTVQADPEAAISEVSRRLSTKRIKVFDTCTNWAAQYRAYRRDKDGDLVEESDGLMRCMDLLALYGKETATISGEVAEQAKDEWSLQDRDLVTGY